MDEKLKNNFEYLKKEIHHIFMENMNNINPCPICGYPAIISIHQVDGKNGYTLWKPFIKCTICNWDMDSNWGYENEVEAELYSTKLVEKWNNMVKLKDE